MVEWKIKSKKSSEMGLWWTGFWISLTVNGTGEACDQKTSKFFVSLREESMARHMDVNRVY
jgi:hypothetical protein